jgi:serine/threonine-protein kinase RsbT
MLDEARVPIQSLADIVAARQRGRELAARAGFSSVNLTLIASAISEVARNIVDFAEIGEVTITLLENGNRKGVKIVATDRGPGIADISTAMRDGYSSTNGLGIGLPGAKRVMDEFEVTSQPGKGTTVTMKKWTA